MDDDNPTFTSSEDESRYWRSLAKDLQDQLTTSKDDLDTLTESSKDLADELLLLEKDLTERERKESDYTARIQHLQAELQDVKAKYTAALRDHANTLSHMQVELESVRKSEQSFRTRVRDMELDNDDLEKAERALSGTLVDLESRYNRSLERCAMLEEELVLSARLAEDVQRLKDELRDANEELTIVKDQLASMPRAPSRPLTPPGAEARTGLAGAVAETTITNNPDDEMERLDIDTPPRKSAAEAQPKWTPYRSLIPAAASSMRVQASPDILDNMTSSLLSSTSHSSLVGNSFDNKVGLPRSATSRNLAKASATPPQMVRSTSGLPQIKRSTPKSIREERTQGVINDLKSMTDRIKQLKARVDTRARQSIGGPSGPQSGVHASGSNLPRLRRTSNICNPIPNSSHAKSPGSLEDEFERVTSPSTAGRQIKRPPSRLSIMTSASKTSDGRPTTPHRRPTTPAESSFINRLKAENKGRPSINARSSSISVARTNSSPAKKRLSMQGAAPNARAIEGRRPASRAGYAKPQLSDDDERW